MRIERWLYTIPLRLRSLFRRHQVEEELDEEFRYHVERKTDQYIAQGLPPEAARRSAMRDIWTGSSGEKRNVVIREA